ncbi:MAG TPA: 4'-phosphopantetheinyl transferase superfamily protein [Rhodothermales bacterium]|nr:4'-phosphopantetheinyl transferase superfamily protein [Rhodothermales bacterium]
MPVRCPFPTNYIKLVSEEEWNHAATFANENRRATYLAGRLAMRTLLMPHLNQLPQEIPLFTEPSGAPAILSAPHLYVSVTHTVSETAAVFASAPVGIDLEHIQKRRDDLWKFLLAPNDYEAFHALDAPQNEKNILLWVIKEAVLKGLKTGFRLSPKKIHAHINLAAQEAIVTDHNGQNWMVPFTRHGDCWLAVALLQSKKR